jgi:hypothetical protein
MPQKEVAIVGHNNTKAAVTGQQELLVKVNNPLSATITSPLGSQLASASVSVAIASDQASKIRIPVAIASFGDTLTLITDVVKSISFASNGTDDALITVDGGATFITLAPGTTVNLDAGGIDNSYIASIFGYDTDSNPGSSLIIVYNMPF